MVPAMRMDPKLRRDLLFTMVASVLFLLPIWSVDLLPMGDLGHHVAVATILKDFHRVPAYESSFVFTHWYSSNSTCYYILAALFHAMRPETATRLLVSAYALGLPLAYIYFLHGLRCPTWPAVLSPLFIFNRSFTNGYLNFLLATVFLFLSLGVCLKHHEKPTVRRGIVFGALVLLTYWTHVVVFGLLIVVAVGLSFLGPRVSLREYLVRLAPASVSVLAAIAWLVTGLSKNVAHRSGQSSILALFRGQYLDPREMVGMMATDLAHVSSDRAEGYIVLGVVVVGAVLVVISRAHGERSRRSTLAALLISASAWLLLFACPMHFSFNWDISPRFIPIVWLSSLTLIAHELPEKPYRWAMGSVVVLLAVDAFFLLGRFRAYGRQVAPVRKMADLVATGSRVARLNFAPGDRSVMHNGGVYWHLDKYLMPWKQTLEQDILPSHPTCIFQLREGVTLPPVRDDRFWLDPTLKLYDYLITYGAQRAQLDQAIRSHDVEPLLMEGGWALFRVRH